MAGGRDREYQPLGPALSVREPFETGNTDPDDPDSARGKGRTAPTTHRLPGHDRPHAASRIRRGFQPLRHALSELRVRQNRSVVRGTGVSHVNDRGDAMRAENRVIVLSGAGIVEEDLRTGCSNAAENSPPFSPRRPISDLERTVLLCDKSCHRSDPNRE